jgi:hypothetical protein
MRPGDVTECPRHGAVQVVQTETTPLSADITEVVGRCDCGCAVEVTWSHPD